MLQRHSVPTHQPSPSIPYQQKGAHHFGIQCPTDPDCHRAVTALVPTISGMGDHVSGRVRRAICRQIHSGTRLTDLPYDEDIHTTDTSMPIQVPISGPITRARARQLNHEKHSENNIGILVYHRHNNNFNLTKDQRYQMH